jgi:hypothetical protein
MEKEILIKESKKYLKMLMIIIMENWRIFV